MKFARAFLTNTSVGVLVVLPIYLAMLVLLKGMESVAGLVRPFAMLLPEWAPAEKLLSLVLVVIVCCVIGIVVRTRAGEVLRERIETSFFSRLPGYALFSKSYTATLRRRPRE
jgi:uncharacterized membrane protein